MKVRISGFQLTYHAKLAVDTLATALHEKQNTRIVWSPHERVLRVVKDGDYILGSLLTDRGHRAFVAIDSETNALSRGRLAKGKNFGAFSFFVLCKRKPAAIITSYRDAGGAAFVFGVLRKIGDEVLHSMKDKQTAAEGIGIPKGRRAAIDREYAPPSLEWVEYLGRNEYDAVLRRWKRIKAVEVSYVADKAPAAFVPFDGDDLDSAQLRLSFKSKTLVGQAVDYVKRLRSGRSADGDAVLKVDGVNELGLHCTLRDFLRVRPPG